MIAPTLCEHVIEHGYGHAVRTGQTLRALPPGVRIVAKTTAPECLFRGELPGRDVQVVDAGYDRGSLQSDGLTVLPRETLARDRGISERNKRRLSDEADFLRREEIACVASDIAPLPLLHVGGHLPVCSGMWSAFRWSLGTASASTPICSRRWGWMLAFILHCRFWFPADWALGGLIRPVLQPMAPRRSPKNCSAAVGQRRRKIILNRRKYVR